jgi:hypothetical protein
MRPTSSKEHEEEGPKPVNDTNNTEASITPSSSTCQPFEILWPRLPSLSRPSARTTPSNEIAHKISKKKKEQRWNSAFFYFALLLTQQIFIQPIKNHLINSSDNFKSGFKLQEDSTASPSDYSYSPLKELNTKMYSFGETEQYNDGSREHFNPAGGKFQYGQNDFFAPRFRWRNDAELASYAWNRQGKSEVNMMMTENRVPSYGPTTSDKASCAPRDPSLLDYDAIDVSWRNDIEREKSRPSEYASQQRDMYDSQFERDLQVLHEKGYTAPFTTEETNRYEELSKAQFADFYRTVAVPSKSSSYGQSNVLPSSSRFTNYSTTPSTSVFRHSFGADQEDSQHSECHRSDDGYGSNDSGFGSHSEDERNGDDRSSSGDMFYNIHEDIPEPQQQHFDNITLAYQPYSAEENIIIPQQSSVPAIISAPTSDEPSPVLGHYTENGPETLETTLQLDEDEYLKYVTNQQVLEDISESATEQSFEAANEVLERIQRQHENSDVAVDFTPFDEPLPFLDDDFFLNVEETLNDVVASSNLNTTLSSSSVICSSLSRSASPSQNYRLYGKLVPEIKFENDENEREEYDDEDDTHSSDNKNQRRRGRQSKDNDLVKKHELPATAEELAAMSHKALQNLLKDPQLTDTQKSLIKRIRRRGRNKEAARKCRERRILPSETPSTSSSIKIEPTTISTSNQNVVHRPFILYPPTRKVA